VFVVGGAPPEPAGVAAADEEPDGAASEDGEPAGDTTAAAGGLVGLVEQAATKAAKAIVAITLMRRTSLSLLGDASLLRLRTRTVGLCQPLLAARGNLVVVAQLHQIRPFAAVSAFRRDW
jgi:hypothetical protein